MNILVAEDEQDIRELLELHLLKDGYEVFKARNGLEALEILKREKIHLALLDVMMEGMDGFNLLKELRKWSEIPVIFLTAKIEDDDKILGLGLGADDYVIKPFKPVELMARIKSNLRRCYKYSGEEENKIIKIYDLELYKDSCIVKRNGEELSLNAKEFKILEMLMGNIGRVFTKKQIYENVWKEYYLGDDNTIMVHISHLREKIEEDPKKPLKIKTIRGIGYRFEKNK
ncbi:response regulator transcription factor [Clostridium sp.]|uniref:response regulator transcription factor n=1 Tax=Clostridium sp. TaxID=1506 RepID=UPI00263590D0|nr:response regulator transcription factor [Clostridium sp.]